MYGFVKSLVGLFEEILIPYIFFLLVGNLLPDACLPTWLSGILPGHVS
jgi:hypothetical protein